MSASESHYIAVLYSLSSFDDSLTTIIERSIRSINEKLHQIGFKIINWKVEKDTLSLIIFLHTLNPALKDTAEIILSQELNKNLDHMGIKISRILVSNLEKPLSVLVDTAYLRFLLNILSKYIKHIMQFAQQPSLFEQFSDTHLADQTFKENGKLRALIRNKPLFENFIKNWGEILRLLNENELKILFLLYKLRNVEEKDIMLEKIVQISQINANGLLQILKNLENKNLVSYLEDHIKLTEKSANFIRSLLQLIEEVEKSTIRKISGALYELFSKMEKPPRYLVHRNGRVDLFSFGKLMESLILSGIDYDTTSKVLDGVYEYASNLKLVSKKEMVYLIKALLRVIDPTGESAIKFEYFINTKNYLLISYGNIDRPISRELIKNMIKARLNNVRPKMISPALSNFLASRMLDSIRLLFMPSVIDTTREVPIKLNHSLLEMIIDAVLEETVPFVKSLKEIPKNSDASFIRKELESAKDLFSAISDDTNTHYYFNYFAKAAKKLLWTALFLFDYWPHPSVISSATILMHISKKKRRLSSAENLFLKRLEEFARRASQVIIRYHSKLVEESEDKADKSLLELAKFGKKLCDQLIEKID